MDLIPDDVIRDILLEYCCPTLENVLSLMLVSKRFERLVRASQGLWKRLFLSRYPLVNDKLQLKSWYTMMKRRSSLGLRYNERSIENCNLVFQCPLSWHELSGPEETTEEGLTCRKCGECDRTVFLAETDWDLRRLAQMGECVAFRGIEEETMMGMWVDDSDALLT